MFPLAYPPLSEHEGGFGFSLIVGRRRAANDDGGPTVSTQRVLQDTGHLAVSVWDVGLSNEHRYKQTNTLTKYINRNNELCKNGEKCGYFISNTVNGSAQLLSKCT